MTLIKDNPKRCSNCSKIIRSWNKSNLCSFCLMKQKQKENNNYYVKKVKGGKKKMKEEELNHEFPEEQEYDRGEGSGVGMPIISQPVEPSVGIIKELSPLKVLTRVRENLKGRFWDEEKKEYVSIEGYEPLLNNYGISKYLSILASTLNDVITMSNIPMDEVNRLVLHVCDRTIPIMYINYKEWGIKQKSDLGILDNQILMMTYGALRKGAGAGDRNLVRGTISEQIQQRQGMPFPSEKGKGFLSKINPFSKN